MPLEKNLNTDVFRTKPSNFFPKMEVSGCYIESNGRFLFLKRSMNKVQGGKWGAPAGKLEKRESPRQAVIREVFEETGIQLDITRLQFVEKFFIRRPDHDFMFYVYYQKFSEPPKVILNDEHLDFLWLNLNEITDTPLVSGGEKIFHHFINLINQPVLKKKEFYFIRHGQTDVNLNPSIKRIDYDLSLNINGINQAKLAKSNIAKIPFKSVCFSPIKRAVQTKNILVDSLNIKQIEMNDLSECKATVWSKMIKIESRDGYQPCDDVESFLKNVKLALDKVLEQDSPVLVVSHGGVHWAICYLLMIENHLWKIGNCDLVHFYHTKDLNWQAKIIND